MDRKTHDGAKVYTPLTLKLYDWWVLSVSNRFAWRCETDKYLLPHFLKNLGSCHLDIGVGSGYYLTNIPEACSLTLMDLNENSLMTAASRAGDTRELHTVRHDVFEPFPGELKEKFDSVSLFYLLHCLPGTMQDKASVIQHAAEALTENGILSGATILTGRVKHNAFGHKLLKIYNQKGIFSNQNDSAEALHTILSASFHNVSISVVNTVGLFSASKKRQ
ncbi:TPA: class I SAM-dependent methyltransferase [Raoultella planticola]|nr:class I SAM-dependent methyltransferase [Raoultella planticola]